jgi:hypothetical protein
MILMVKSISKCLDKYRRPKPLILFELDFGESDGGFGPLILFELEPGEGKGVSR